MEMRLAGLKADILTQKSLTEEEGRFRKIEKRLEKIETTLATLVEGLAAMRDFVAEKELLAIGAASSDLAASGRNGKAEKVPSYENRCGK